MTPEPPPQPCPQCGSPMTYCPPEPNFGADADGNRGVPVPAQWACNDPECHQYGTTLDVEPDDPD